MGSSGQAFQNSRSGQLVIFVGFLSELANLAFYAKFALFLQKQVKFMNLSKAHPTVFVEQCLKSSCLFSCLLAERSNLRPLVKSG